MGAKVLFPPCCALTWFCLGYVSPDQSDTRDNLGAGFCRYMDFAEERNSTGYQPARYEELWGIVGGGGVEVMSLLEEDRS